MKHLVLFFFGGIFFLLTDVYAQSLALANVPSKTTYPPGIPEGDGVYGAFEGRTPCQEIARELGIKVGPECTKRKWLLVLTQDPATHKLGSYKIEGVGDWNGEGKWSIIKGSKENPNATVYQLDRPGKNSLFLLKGDDNVLFVLDHNKNFLVGGADHSYTLNRVRN